MIGMRSLAALALASVASFTAACSSSGGSSGTATTFACADNESMTPTSPNSACTSCVESNCNSQVTAAYGSGFADGNISGGACGSYVSCIAPCACNDTACSQKCTTMLTSNNTCVTALETAGNCIDTSCSTQCNTSSSSGGSSSGTTTSSSGTSTGTGTTSSSSGGTGSSSGGSGGACDESASSGFCLEGFPSADCSAAGGTAIAKCPTTNLAGCCTANSLTTCFYTSSGVSASDAMMECSAESGTFSTTP